MKQRRDDAGAGGKLLRWVVGGMVGLVVVAAVFAFVKLVTIAGDAERAHWRAEAEAGAAEERGPEWKEERLRKDAVEKVRGFAYRSANPEEDQAALDGRMSVRSRGVLERNGEWVGADQREGPVREEKKAECQAYLDYRKGRGERPFAYLELHRERAAKDFKERELAIYQKMFAQPPGYEAAWPKFAPEAWGEGGAMGVKTDEDRVRAGITTFLHAMQGPVARAGSMRWNREWEMDKYARTMLGWTEQAPITDEEFHRRVAEKVAGMRGNEELEEIRLK